MIDPSSETLLTFREAATRLPARRRGTQTHPATFYRWVRDGLRGVHLEAIRVGGMLCTSEEALSRFLQRLTLKEEAR